MKKIAPDNRILLITTALVAVIGAQTVGDLVRAEGGETPTVSAPTEEAPRAPASLAHTEVKPPAPQWREPMVEWNCTSEVQPSMAVRGNYLRFKGKGCGQKFNVDQLMIVNETNGFTASVFAKGSERYETDLIQLREGVNRIRIQYLNSAKKKKEVVFDVQSSAI